MNRSEAKKFRLRIGTLVLILGVLAILSADAFSMPVWRKTGATTTFEEWSFKEWNYYGPFEPDPNWKNDFETPLLQVSNTAQWTEYMGQHQGVWTLGGEMDLMIPNFQVAQPKKEIWLELTWKGSSTRGFLPNKPIIGIGCDYEDMQMHQELLTTDNEGWNTTLFKIDIWPNPPLEYITIKGNILVDQVVIDTECIPEPATLGLLIGGVFLALRRKRNG
jgi:hypothetical protein